MRKTYWIMTYGCQMNVHESEKIAGILEEFHYRASNSIEEADVIVFNTCCIRDNAEKKILGNIGEIKHLKKKNKDLIIAVLGCMTQQEGVAENIRKSFPYVEIICGANELPQFRLFIKEITQKRAFLCNINKNVLPPIDESIPVFRTSGTNAWINIMYGCNNFCTYCIVPFVRGRERSRLPQSIISEAKTLVLEENYKELTLLGQNVDSYSCEGYNFAALLKEIASINSKFRLRFMTSHPKDFNDDVIDIIKDSPNICNNIHLPVQSGSDRILKLMNRHYDRQRYLDIIYKIKNALPNVGITSDIMVGFPTETDEDFEETIKLVQEVRFSTAFTFVYSPRNGTAAAKMEQLSEEIKKERIMRLVELQNSITAEISKEYIGRTEEILVEDINAKRENYLCGRTDSGRLVNFQGESSLIGSFVNVTIEKTKSAALWGSIKNE